MAHRSLTERLYNLRALREEEDAPSAGEREEEASLGLQRRHLAHALVWPGEPRGPRGDGGGHCSREGEKGGEGKGGRKGERGAGREERGEKREKTNIV